MEPERLPIEPGVSRKHTKSTSRVEHFTEETHETIGQTGQFEKRTTTSETREEKTTVTEIIESYGGTALTQAEKPVPRQFRLILSGVVATTGGCAEAHQLDGD